MFPTLKKMFTKRNITIGLVGLTIYYLLKKRKYTTVYIQQPQTADPTPETAETPTPTEEAPTGANVTGSVVEQVPSTPAEESQIPQEASPSPQPTENVKGPGAFLYGPQTPYELQQSASPTGFYYDWEQTF